MKKVSPLIVNSKKEKIIIYVALKSLVNRDVLPMDVQMKTINLCRKLNGLMPKK